MIVDGEFNVQNAHVVQIVDLIRYLNGVSVLEDVLHFICIDCIVIKM